MDAQGLHPVEFRFEARRVPRARRVAVVGPFNGWNPETHRLAPGPDGWWSLSVPLPPGMHLYLFMVDGYPYNDPHDDGRVPCEWGGWYSVRRVRPPEQVRPSAA